MKPLLLIGLIAGIAAAVSGCAHNSVVADDSSGSGVIFGSLGIWGNNNTRTIEAGSSLKKVSIIGDGNEIIIEDGVKLTVVEIWGQDNTISIPEGLVIRQPWIGKGNRVIRRPAAMAGTPAKVASDAPAPSEASAEKVPSQDDPSSP